MRFSVSTKIFLGFAVVIASFGIVSLYSIHRMRSLGENLRFVREGVIPARDALRELRSELKAFEEAFGRRRASDLEWVRSFLPSLRPYARIDTMRARVGELAGRPHLRPRDRAPLQTLAAELGDIGRQNGALEGLRKTGGLPAVLAALEGPDAPTTDRGLYDVLARTLGQKVTEGHHDAAVQMQTALRGIFRRVDKDLVALGRRFDRAIDTTYTQAARDEDSAILAVVIISTVALLISLAALLISHLTLSPIRHLREGVRRISEGDYGRRVHVSTQDEIGQLAAEFNKMVASLVERDHILARQREELVRAERLATIGKMSSQITHEIRNPLSSIGLNVELLEEELEAAATGDAAAVDEGRALLRAVTDEVDRLRDVTEHYLRFARLPEPERVSTDLVLLLEDLLVFLGGELEGQAIETELALDPLPALHLDGQQLRQAFLNLVRNAAEAMPDGGRIRVSTRREGPHAVVRLSDTGVGIPEEHLGQLFDPFFSTKRTGTGLGLALTQQMISQHGGSIEVESAQGEGTTVSVRLPLDIPGAPD